MSNDSTSLVRPVPSSALTPPLDPGMIEIADPSAAPKGVNPLHVVHAALRGRYWLAAILAVVGLVAGGWVGSRAIRPQYESVGAIRVRPSLSPVLSQTDQTGVLPMFDSYVDAQASLIGSQRVILLAMQDPNWKAVRSGDSNGDIARFTASLTVTRPRNSEMVFVAFDDVDPDAAQRAVGATLDAYQRINGEDDSENVSQRVQLLEERRVTLTNELKAINDRMSAIATEFGSNTLDKVYDFKLSELDKLESELHATQMAVAQAPADIGSTPTASSASPVTEQALARQSDDYRSLLTAKRNMEMELVSQRIYLGEHHPVVQAEEAKLEAIKQEMRQLALVITATPQAAQSIDPNRAFRTKAELQAQQVALQQLYEVSKSETVEIGRKCVELQSLRADAEEKKTSLDETSKRIEQLNLESSIGGRISVTSRGDRPLGPVKDKRLVVAAGCGVGLAALGVGLLLCIGLADGRVRHISDVSANMMPGNRLLGVLPQLPDDLSDPLQAMLAAHSVHQIRSLLQCRRDQDAKAVLTITSPSPGAGKTSLSVALGLSYAASGSNTLLIDCDIVGGGLTSKLKKMIHCRLGHLLRREGRITPEQFQEAMNIAKRTDKRLGEVLVESGWITEDEIRAALDEQRKTSVGLREAMTGDPVEECIVATGTPRLSIMPLGTAQRRHVPQLTYGTLLRIIEQARAKFDVIVIDTGPILGSLEGPVATLVADDVILTIARGEKRPLVEKSVQFLLSNHANLAGIVLNRADARDMALSGHSSSTSRMSGRDSVLTPEALVPVRQDMLRLGPVGTAVASLMDVNDHSGNGNGSSNGNGSRNGNGDHPSL